MNDQPRRAQTVELVGLFSHHKAYTAENGRDEDQRAEETGP